MDPYRNQTLLGRFCICLSLRGGAVVSSIWSSCLAVAAIVHTSSIVRSLLHSEHDKIFNNGTTTNGSANSTLNTGSQSDNGLAYLELRVVMGFAVLAGYSLWMWSALIMTIGVILYKRSLLIPWMVVAVLMYPIEILAVAAEGFGNPAEAEFMIGVRMVGLAIDTYCLIGVICYFQHMPTEIQMQHYRSI